MKIGEKFLTFADVGRNFYFFGIMGGMQNELTQGGMDAPGD